MATDIEVERALRACVQHFLQTRQNAGGMPLFRLRNSCHLVRKWSNSQLRQFIRSKPLEFSLVGGFVVCYTQYLPTQVRSAVQ